MTELVFESGHRMLVCQKCSLNSSDDVGLPAARTSVALHSDAANNF